MKLKLGLQSSNDCPEIKLLVSVDNKVIFENSATEQEQIIELELPDSPATHCLAIELSGKTSRHTTVNSLGEIVSDIHVIVPTLEIQGIDVKPIFCMGKLCYYHSFNNPSAEIIEDEFQGYIGCNGVVKIEFFTPIYLWLANYF